MIGSLLVLLVTSELRKSPYLYQISYFKSSVLFALRTPFARYLEKKAVPKFRTLTEIPDNLLRLVHRLNLQRSFSRY